MSYLRASILTVALVCGWLALGSMHATAAGLAQDTQPTATSVVTSTQEYGVRCDSGVCEMSLAIGEDGLPVDRTWAQGASLLLKALPDRINPLPDGTGIEVSDDLTLTLPIGALALTGADLTLEMNDARQVERLRGTARLPLPTLGLFDSAEIIAPGVADVGMDLGKNLTHLDLPLYPDRRYLFLDFRSGVDVVTRTADDSTTGPFRFSVPKGQIATVVIDTEDPAIFLNGSFALRHSGELGLVTDLALPGGDGIGLDNIPLGGRSNLRVALMVTGDPSEASLDLEGGYAIGTGRVGAWLGMDAEPIVIEGSLKLDRSGLALSGLASADLNPDVIMDTDLQAQIFVPFSDMLRKAHVQVDGKVALPVVGFLMGGTAGLDGEEGLIVSGTMDTPFDAAEEEVAATSPESEAGEGEAAQTEQSGGVRDTVAKVAEQAADYAGSGYGWVKDATTGSYRWVAGGTSTAVEAATSQVVRGWQSAMRTICSVSGRCSEEPAADQVAEAPPEGSADGD